MDPNAALNNIREAVGELRQQDDDGVLDGTSQVGFLLESVEALDEWLTKGGFLPDAWTGGGENERILGVVGDWTDEEFELALGFPRPKPGPGQPGSIGITGPDGRMVWRFDYEHTHEYQGQKLTHSHPHHGPHGYFEHPEDVGAPVEPGSDTDVPYAREEQA